jgi:hypothetical protein
MRWIMPAFLMLAVAAAALFAAVRPVLAVFALAGFVIGSARLQWYASRP